MHWYLKVRGERGVVKFAVRLTSIPERFVESGAESAFCVAFSTTEQDAILPAVHVVKLV